MIPKRMSIFQGKIWKSKRADIRIWFENYIREWEIKSTQAAFQIIDAEWMHFIEHSMNISNVIKKTIDRIFSINITQFRTER